MHLNSISESVLKWCVIIAFIHVSSDVIRGIGFHVNFLFNRFFKQYHGIHEFITFYELFTFNDFLSIIKYVTFYEFFTFNEYYFFTKQYHLGN